MVNINNIKNNIFICFIFKGKNQIVKWEGSNKSGHETLSADLTDSWYL